MDPLTQLFIIIGGIVLITAAITAYLVAGKPMTVTTVTIDAKNIYQRLLECAKLATAESEFSQVFRRKEETKHLWGFAKSTKNFEVDYAAKVVAGLDLSKSGLEIDVGNRKVYLRNPACEVIAVDVDFEQSREFYSFLNKVTSEDRDRYYKEVKDHIRTMAIDKGLLIDAETRAIKALSGLTRSMGLTLIAQAQDGSREEKLSISTGKQREQIASHENKGKPLLPDR